MIQWWQSMQFHFPDCPFEVVNIYGPALYPLYINDHILNCWRPSNITWYRNDQPPCLLIWCILYIFPCLSHCLIYLLECSIWYPPINFQKNISNECEDRVWKKRDILIIGLKVGNKKVRLCDLHRYVANNCIKTK